MTHDELLAKIDNVGHSVEYGHGIDTSRIVKQLSALRAVVELHKPAPILDGNNSYPSVSYIQNCWYCRTPIPCKTIQAIEKELQ